MKWFYAKDGQQSGPVEFPEIERLHREGQLTGESLVWQQGTPGWVKLSSVLGAASGATGETPSPSAATVAPGSPIASLGKVKSDYGSILCWGFIGVLIPCGTGILIYIALMVLHCIEFFETRQAVIEGRLLQSDYSRIHPVLFILGFICCGGLLYPLFMYYREKSGYFQPQPYGVLVAILVVVISLGLTVGMFFMQGFAETIMQSL